MSFRTMELPGMQLKKLQRLPQQIVLEFVQADIIKTMEGAKQRTHWRQSGEIVLMNPQGKELPVFAGTAIVAGGHITDNIYVYQDMIRLPLHSFGDIELALTFEGDTKPLNVHGTEIRVNLFGTPQYIEHLDD